MRAAYICADPGVPVFGQKGASVHIQEVLRAMVARGVEVELFASRAGGDAPPGLSSIRLHRLPPLPKDDTVRREQAALAGNCALRAALQQARRERGSFDLVYERYSLWSFAAMEYARATGVPGLLEVNAPLVEEQAQHRVLLDRPGAERVAARVFGAASTLIAVSREVAAYLKRYPAVVGAVHVIPNGVNPDRFRPDLAPALPRRPGTFTVGFVGTLKPWHGLSGLVAAFADLHRRAANTHLLIVGDGPGQVDLTADVSARGLHEAVCLTGAVAPSDVPGLLASMDAAVAPYPRQAGFYFSPLKVYEYMAAGLPVVASRIGQLEEVIEDGVNGLLCQPGDVEAIAAALDRLRQAPEFRSRLGAAARATVLRGHTWDAVVDRILRLAASQPAPLSSADVIG